MEIKIKRKEATISSDTIEIPAQGSAYSDTGTFALRGQFDVLHQKEM